MDSEAIGFTLYRRRATRTQGNVTTRGVQGVNGLFAEP